MRAVPKQAPPPRDPTGRAPPNDVHRECALLGAILVDRPRLDEVIDTLAPEHFYSEANATIYAAALDLARASQPVDVVTVKAKLAAQGRLQSVGDVGYLGQLTSDYPHVGDAERHARALRDLWRVRQTIATCQRIAAEGYGQLDESASNWLSDVAGALAVVADDDVGAEAKTLREVLIESTKRLWERDNEPSLPTGLADLDRVLGGMRGGQLIEIAAWSGIGKSALALNIAIRVALTPAPVPCAVAAFSAEMSAAELAERALFGEALVDTAKVYRKHTINQDEWARLADAATRLGTMADRFWIDDRSDLSVAKIRAKARRLQHQARRRGASLGLIVVDYAQLLDAKAEVSKDANREAEVAAVGRGMKRMAKELDVPVILLAQLNADSQKKGQRPRMADLRESKALGMDADKIILIDNPHAAERAEQRRNGEEATRDLDPEVVKLIVDKNRGGGRTGTVEVLFFPQYTTFENYRGAT